MTIQIEHTLSKEEAKDRIEGLIERYQGNLDIRDGAVNLDFYVPFMLQVFSKKIKSAIHDRIQQSLA